MNILLSKFVSNIYECLLVFGFIYEDIQRSHLIDSLRGWVIGWMEMGLTQFDAARRLNVSCIVVQRLRDQFHFGDSVSRRLVAGRRRVIAPAENCFLTLSARSRKATTVPQLVSDHFTATGTRISATTM
ncbi:hypothetical protein AVEN_263639-1 [Araneus ventricosus]|uniref:Uncharacterized protein n=1 Tax=Araneus ventricosus TaxID=182803 RepID=A0A4Y2ARY3_ARAVE|nr:hypothetical protein AVEN_263639-1 [Araneus ventricosus]